MVEPTRRRSVFVNCPFDPAYRPLFDGVVFTLAFCGFTVRSALEVRDSGELRLAKIVRLIEQSRLSIHDISRVEPDAQSGLPRFNMPIELGIAIGMRYLGRARLRDHALLVLDTERYRYQAFASDLAGVDIAAHHGELPGVIAAVRDFLLPHADGHLPGHAAVLDAYSVFRSELAGLASSARQRVEDLTYTDRLRHLATFMESLA